jgi:hypothetical protein
MPKMPAVVGKLPFNHGSKMPAIASASLFVDALKIVFRKSAL